MSDDLPPTGHQLSVGIKLMGLVILLMLAGLTVGYLRLVQDREIRDIGQRRQECIANASGHGFNGYVNLITPLLDDSVIEQLPPEYQNQIRHVSQPEAVIGVARRLVLVAARERHPIG